MKKKIMLLSCFIVFLCCGILNVNAVTYKVKITYNDVNMRTGPGTNYDNIKKLSITNYDNIKKLSINSEYKVVEANKVQNEKGCAFG